MKRLKLLKWLLPLLVGGAFAEVGSCNGTINIDGNFVDQLFDWGSSVYFDRGCGHVDGHGHGRGGCGGAHADDDGNDHDDDD